MTKRAFGWSIAGCLLTAAILSGCGGGGGGTSLSLPGGGGSHPTPAPSPTAAATPALIVGFDVAVSGTNPGNAGYAHAGNASVDVSCGCSNQAGSGTTDASGDISLVATSTPKPSAPNPTYTIVPGRNYVEVATTNKGAQAWNMQFAVKSPVTNVSLESTNRTDAFTAAATLYVYYNSPSGVEVYDNWNINTVVAWINALKTSPNAAETTLLDDIVTESVANHGLYPSAPPWNPSQATNAKIAKDLKAVTSSVDAAKPTPCPGQCAGAPTP